MLTGNEILKRIESKDIMICPFNADNLNPNSYNLTLNDRLKIYTANPLDPHQDNHFYEVVIPEEGYIIRPNILYIGSTNEYTETRNLVPCINGRSSTGRLGISIHVTAGFGDVGFCGKWTLEITAVQPVILYPNMKIAQIYYEEIQGEPTSYNGRYQGQMHPETSRFFKG